MNATCFWGSLCLSNLASDSILKFYGTGTPQISSERGWGARIILLLALLDVKDVVLQSLILEIQIVDGGTYFLYSVLFASITTIG